MSVSEYPRRIGKYEILGVIGRGGMGIVYLARDPIIDRTVAVKTIVVSADVAEEDLVQRLRMEARSAGRLHHPNIVTVYDFGQEGNLSYIVFEYAEGEDLSRLIDRAVPMSLLQKLDILVQISHGLAYAHELGVMHRDMKPSNVLLTKRGRAKIVDFGLARADTTRLTKTGYLTGTIAYMSPERIHGTSGKSDDIFALGAIAYELLTYRRAFPGSAPPEIMFKILQEPPPPPSTLAELPVELDPVILKALAREVSDRYSTAADFAADIETLRSSDSLKTFLDDPQRSEQFRQAVGCWIEPKALTPAVTGDAATEIVSEGPYAPTDISAQPTEIVKAAAGTPTVVEASGLRDQQLLPTEIVPSPPLPARGRRRWMTIAAAGAVAVAVAAAILIGIRPNSDEQEADRVQPSPPPPVTKTETGELLPAASDVELQQAVYEALREDLSQVQLQGPERLKFLEAQAKAKLASERLNRNDYAGGSALMTDAITSMRELLGSRIEKGGAGSKELADSVRMSEALAAYKKVEERVEAKLSSAQSEGISLSSSDVSTLRRQLQALRNKVEVSQPRSITAGGEEIIRMATRLIEKARPKPQPIPVPPPPEPKKDDTTTTTPPPPSVEEIRAEIVSFVQRLAAAYQSRDIVFFRAHWSGFDEQMERAIKTSPSVRVSMVVERVDLSDPSRPTVTVTRTDWFADSDAPAAVQRLIYHLTRSGSSWKIIRAEQG